MSRIKQILHNPVCYHYIRQAMIGGLPFQDWIRLCGLDQEDKRIADLGCGPADILRHVSSSQRPDFYLGIDISESFKRLRSLCQSKMLSTCFPFLATIL